MVYWGFNWFKAHRLTGLFLGPGYLCVLVYVVSESLTRSVTLPAANVMNFFEDLFK